MPGIALVGVHVAGGVITGPGASGFTIDGAPVAVLGDDVAGHGSGPHTSPKMAQASTWMTWNGKPVCRAGNAASCGDQVNGHATWSIE